MAFQSASSLEAVLESVNRGGVDDMLRKTVPRTDLITLWMKEFFLRSRRDLLKDSLRLCPRRPCELRPIWEMEELCGLVGRCSPFLSKSCSTRWDHLVASSPLMLLTPLNVVFARRRVPWSLICLVAARWMLFQTLYILLEVWRPRMDSIFNMRSDIGLCPRPIIKSSQSSLLKFLLTIASMERALAALLQLWYTEQKASKCPW